MNRRTFIHHLPLLAVPASLSRFSAPFYKKRGYIRYLTSSIAFPSIPFPEEKRIPLGITAVPVPAYTDTYPRLRLKFQEVTSRNQPLYFRLTAAIDFREEKTVRLYLPESGHEIGRLNIKYAHPFQPFQATLNAEWIPEINQQGIALEMIKGTQTPWFFQSDVLPPDTAGLAPQLLTGKRPASEKEFLRTLYSMNSFSPFGWMGGCVQDALYELHLQGNTEAKEALETQLGYYLDDQKGIIFESPHTQPLDGTFNSIEDFLPFAAIANLYPDHPSVQKAVDFCLDYRNDQGMILAGKHITTEGCYTVAYPLAMIARIRKDAALAQVALDQLRYRTQYLAEESAIYQRSNLDGEKAYRNWGRGVAWYLLGTIKTLAVLQESSFKLSGKEEVQQDFVSAALMADSWKNADDLWYGYLDQPQTKEDTSASAGIAAALAWGVQSGLLPNRYRRSAKSTYQALQKYLTPDGFLTQVSQINRGGEALQKNGYRVISQFGMGLMAQLKAALSI